MDTTIDIGSPEDSNPKMKMISRFDEMYVTVRIIIAGLMLIPGAIWASIKYYVCKRKSLEGKICLVTGAGRGLGRGLCLELSRLGAVVICVDIREDSNNETVKMVRDAGGKAHGYVCNIAKYNEVMNLAETVQKEVGRVYMLINNAGLIMTHKAGDWPPEDVISMFNVNVISHYWTIQAFLPAMKEVNEGHIVNILSQASLQTIPPFTVYGPTKAAGNNFLQMLRLELNQQKGNKVLVSGVYPTVINTSADIARETTAAMLTIDEAAKTIIDEVRRDNTFILVPKRLCCLIFLMRLFPEMIFVKVTEIMKTNSIPPPNENAKQTMLFGKLRDECL